MCCAFKKWFLLNFLLFYSCFHVVFVFILLSHPLSAAETLKSRLQRVIQLKLDDAALEMMCSSYTRNLRLFLSPADVEFLQPSPDQPSEVVSLLLPQWIRNPNTFFFYLLQQLSLVFLQPQYTQVVDNKERVLLKTPSELSKVLIQYNLPLSLEQDYLFLYIRPVSKGRGEKEGEKGRGREREGRRGKSKVIF